MTSLHEPVPDRLFGPLARPVLGRVPPLALTLISLGMAAAVFAAFVADQRVLAGVLVLMAALADAGAALTPRPAPTPNAGGGETEAAPLQAPQPSPRIPPTSGQVAGGGAEGEEGAGAPQALALAIDTVADRYGDVLIFAGMAVWARGQGDGSAPLALGFAAAAGSLGFAYGVVRTWASAGQGPAATLFGRLGRDLRLLVAAAGALTGLVYPALVVLAVAGNLPVFVALARLPRYLRDDPTPRP